MRILYLSADHGIPVLGNKGASVHIRELTRTLRELGHEVVAITPRAGQVGENSLPVELREARLSEAQGAVLRVLEDMEEGHEGGNGLTREIRSLFMNSCLYEQISGIHEVDPIDFIYERQSLWSLSGIAASRQLFVPYVLEVNAPLIVEQETFRSLHLRDLARGIEGVLFRRADALVAVSDGVRNYILERGVASDKVHTISNAVDTARFDPSVCDDRSTARREKGLPAGGFIVGFVGSLKEWHGIRTLVDAMEILWSGWPEVHLLIVGNGPMRGWLEARVGADGQEGKVTWAGEVAHEEIPSYLACMDVAVAPYDDLPGFYFSPLKVFEYMAMEKPVVASRVGQIREIIQDRQTGLLFRPGDGEELARRIGFLKAHPEIMRKLGTEARRSTLRRGDWRQNAREILAIAEDLCERYRKGEAALHGSPIS